MNLFLIENRGNRSSLKDLWYQRLILIGITLALATLFALVSATLNQFAERGPNFELGHSSWWYTFQVHAPNWYMWALLTPLVVAITVRMSKSSIGWLPQLVVYLVTSFLFALCFATAIVPIRTLIISSWGAVFQGEYLSNIVAVLLFRGHIDALFCLGVVGVTHAFLYRKNLRESTEAKLQLQGQLANARFATLQAQVRPHFLFNTLNSIATCIRVGQSEQALTMISTLSELMRSMIGDNERHWIALSEEVAMCELYLSIEQVRFSDRLVVDIDVASDIANAQIPSFMLQPIVENSVQYGIAPNPNSGRISISAKREQQFLKIEIFNTGIPNAPDEAPSGNGIALQNVQRRLEQAYNGRASYDFHVAEDGSSQTAIRIPVDSIEG